MEVEGGGHLDLSPISSLFQVKLDVGECLGLGPNISQLQYFYIHQDWQ